MPAESYLEAAFKTWLRQRHNRDIPAPMVEHQFAPPRRWRFDFCWPEAMVAVEIEGGVYMRGRHQSGDGFLKDAEKYEAAMMAGWLVYRVPGPWVATEDGFVFREAVMDNLRELLSVRWYTTDGDPVDLATAPLLLKR